MSIEIPEDYIPVVETQPVNPEDIDYGHYLLIDGVIVDRSYKEVDLFDEHTTNILADP